MWRWILLGIVLGGMQSTASAYVLKETAPNTDIAIYTNQGGTITQSAAFDGATGKLRINQITNLAGTGAPTFPNGATGITATLSDFSLQSVSAGGTLVLNGGFARLADGREIATYSGSGTTSASFGVNLSTLNLATILTASGGIYSPNTTYYLYIDLAGLPLATQTSDTGRNLVAIVQTNLNLQTLNPNQVNAARFFPLGLAQTTTASNWSTANFGTIATKVGAPPGANSSPTVYTLAKQAIGAPGSVGQVMAGHVIRTDSFPSASANLFWWNLSSTSTTADGSGNTKTLTNSGTTTFTTANIVGATGGAAVSTYGSGGNQGFYIQGGDHTFDPSGPYTVGCWAMTTVWTGGTGSIELATNESNSVSDVGWTLGFVDTVGGTVAFYQSNAAGTAYSARIENIPEAFTSGSWHHFAQTFTGTRFKAYIDGRKVGDIPYSTTHTMTNPNFRISGRLGFPAGTPSNGWANGAISDCFFQKTTPLADDDIRKVYAARIDHNTNTSFDRQLWRANWYRADNTVSQPLDPSWVVSAGLNSVWTDFSPFLSTESVDIRLQDMGISATAVPTRTYDSGYLTAAPSFPITHGLSETPTVVTIQHEVTAGTFDLLPSDHYCSATSTQLNCDLTPLTIGPSNRVRLIASVLPAGLSVIPASTTSPGLVSTTTQTFAGNKTIDNSPSPVTFVVQTTNPGSSASTFQLSNSSNTAFNDVWKMSQGGGTTKITDGAGTGLMTFDLTNSQVQMVAPSTGGCGIGNTCSGTWTATTFPSTNVSAATATTGTWMRVGNAVMAGFNISVTTTTGGGTASLFDFSIPVVSNLDSFTRLNGTCSYSQGGATNEIYQISGNSASSPKRASVSFLAFNTAVRNIECNFIYLVQ